MAAQLNYNYSTPKGVPGGKVDISYDEVVTRINEAVDGDMKFGLAVVTGASAVVGVALPTSAATKDKFEGVVLHAENTEHDMSGKVKIKKDATLSIMRHGHVWGRIDSKATPTYGAPAYVIVDASVGEVGTFTNTASDSKTVDIGAKFGSESDTGIAVIEL